MNKTLDILNDVISTIIFGNNYNEAHELLWVEESHPGPIFFSSHCV